MPLMVMMRESYIADTAERRQDKGAPRAWIKGKGNRVQGNCEERCPFDL